MIGRKNARPFGIRDKLGYLFGDFGNDFTFVLSSSFLMKFYTDVMGVSAATIGIVMMIARFADAFTDVTMGRICDRSSVTRHGKFKPWIRRMCVPVAVASFMIYQSGMARFSMRVKVGYLFITYILWGSVFYTAVNIPYGSMASAISADPDDRQSLSTYRSMGATFAGVIIGTAVPLLAYTKDTFGNTILSGRRFTIISGGCSVLAIGCYLLCFYLTIERVSSDVRETKKKGKDVAEMLKNALENRALISIIVASILMLIAQLTMQSIAGYVYPNYYGNPSAQSVSTVMMMLGMTVAAVCAKPLAKRFGKAEISAMSCGLAVVVNMILYVVRPKQVGVYIAFQTLSWLGLGIFNMVSWALITDVIDYSELKNGVREDGSVYALYSFARKLGQAASAGLNGALLTIIGYSNETAFEPEIINGIFDISVLVPALGFGLLAAVLWFWYPLHKKRVEANVTALRIKRGN